MSLFSWLVQGKQGAGSNLPEAFLAYRLHASLNLSSGRNVNWCSFWLSPENQENAMA